MHVCGIYSLYYTHYCSLNLDITCNLILLLYFQKYDNHANIRSLLIFSVHIHIIYIPSFRLVGGFLVAQLVRIDLEPSHCPFIRAIAFSASTFFVNETNPYPFDFRVWGSRTTRQSLQNEIMRSNKTNLYNNMIKCYSFAVAPMEWSLIFQLETEN